MTISGFTFIRNGITYGYQFLEAIQSILPICDECIVVVGNSDDDTREAILALGSPKIKIIDTIWDDSKREGGRVLADQTNIALDHITGDWGFYIQGDEVIHEKYLPEIHAAMQTNLDDRRIDGLLFHYRHFYGSYDYIATSRDWYRNEIRVVRNDKTIRSWRDAQGFRKNVNGKMVKLRVKQLDAYVNHYGWARPPKVMQSKNNYFRRLWHPDSEIHETNVDSFDYSGIDVLEQFTDSHPAVMEAFINRVNWEFKPDLAIKRYSAKNRISNFVEGLTGWRMGEYKNYEIIK